MVDLKQIVDYHNRLLTIVTIVSSIVNNPFTDHSFNTKQTETHQAVLTPQIWEEESGWSNNLLIIFFWTLI